MTAFGCLVVFLSVFSAMTDAQTNSGTLIGQLSTLFHGVRGAVFALDNKRIRIVGFNYDGNAPAAYFSVGEVGKSGSTPDSRGTRINGERDSKAKLGIYANRNIDLTLPDLLTVSSIQWLSIWCEAFQIDFGHVKIPRGFVAPGGVSPAVFGALTAATSTGVSGTVVMENPQTIRVDNFRFDSARYLSAYFIVGRGATVTCCAGVQPLLQNGRVLRVGTSRGQTLRLTLPAGRSFSNYNWFSIYSFSPRYEDVGHVFIQ